MKITMQEYDDCFSFEMDAETVADAALLTRYATNVTNKIRSTGAYANNNGTLNGHLVVGKRQNARPTIVRAR